jgi:voltage-gated potassium channel Kch
VASLFAVVLDEAGFVEGTRILAITFMAIAITVTLQGLTAAPVARLLKLRSLAHRAVIVAGAGPLARGLADALQSRGRAVTIVDRNETLVDEAREAGLDARVGNALDEDVLAELGAEEAATVVAVTTNSEVNALVTHLAHDAFGVERTFPVLGHPSRGAGPRLLERVGGRIAFGRPIDVRTWEASLGEGTADFVTYRARQGGATRASQLPESVVPVVRVQGDAVEVVTAGTTWRAGDELVLLSRMPESATAALLDASSPAHAGAAGR